MIGDLDHAIQAATAALRRVQPQGHWPDVARIAVEAAAPVLLQATRDRLADLATQTRGYIHHVGYHEHEVGVDCNCTGKLMDALRRANAALDGPAAQEESG